jgi:hypothetical protein
MRALIDKVADLLPALEAKGVVYLFAFAEREDIDRWDVILCSEWADNDWAGTVRFVVDLLASHLDLDERTLIARVAVIPSGKLRIREMPENLDGTVPGDRRVVVGSFLGTKVVRAFVFKAQYPPTDVARESLVNATVAHA